MGIKEKVKKWIRGKLNTAFDNRLESFFLSLFEIEGAKEVLMDIGRGKLIWFQIKTYLEIVNIKQTLIEKYIPDAVKAANATKQSASKSKYSKYLGSINFDDNIQETIRLAYVNIYHKLEGYRTGLVDLVNQRLHELSGSPTNIEQFLKEKFKFKIDDTKNYPETIYRINWICNCVKHYSGYPKRKNPPPSYSGVDSSKKIVRTGEEFCSDVDYLLEYIHRLFKAVILAAGLVRLESIFDNAVEEDKRKLFPSVLTVTSMAVVFYHSMKDESDEEFHKKWEAFVNYYVGKKMSQKSQ